MNKIVLEDMERIAMSDIDWSRFSGKTLLVSGASGFLPAYMVDVIFYLLKKRLIKETKVIALVRNFEKAKKRFSDYLSSGNLGFLVQDVCSPIEIDGNIDFVIHAASQASPRFYGIDPVGTLSANTLGTMNLLKLAYEKSIESFLYFSSSEIYGTLDESKIPTKEEDYGYVDSVNVRSCYAEGKRMGETMCVSWLHQYGVPVKIVRPFHTYGPGMSLDDGRVYADFVSDVVNFRNINMKSDGLAMRSFCYLADATTAFFTVLLNGLDGNAYNVGNPNCEISIIGLARELVDLFSDRKLQVILAENDNRNYLKSSVLRNCPDLTKIEKLGWLPATGIQEGFYKTIISYE